MTRHRPIPLFALSLLAACGGSAAALSDASPQANDASPGDHEAGAQLALEASVPDGVTAPCSTFDYATYTPASTTLTLTHDVEPILQVSCSLAVTCHGATATKMGEPPYLGKVGGSSDAATLMAIHDAIVNKPSAQATALELVKVNDPANSYLMKKIEGTQACEGLMCTRLSNLPPSLPDCGESMPTSADLLPPAEVAIIRDWIKGGANL